MTASRRRTLAKAGVVLLMAAAIRGAWEIHRSLSERRERAETSADMLARMRAHVSEHATNESDLVARQARIEAWRPALLSGETQLQASAELTDLLGALAEDAEVRVIALRPVQSSDTGLVGVAQLRLEAEGPTDGIAQLLDAIEQNEYLLSASGLSVRKQSSGMRVSLLVSAWFLRGAQS